ncbi:MAG: hypothetical protein LBI96_02735 [Odoribacteraceae bacterium]|nr:hypothetical protein [Odoribacteraceae bacterium]
MAEPIATPSPVASTSSATAQPLQPPHNHFSHRTTTTAVAEPVEAQTTKANNHELRQAQLLRLWRGLVARANERASFPVEARATSPCQRKYTRGEGRTRGCAPTVYRWNVL